MNACRNLVGIILVLLVVTSSAAVEELASLKVYVAKKIITMEPAIPEAPARLI